MSFVASASAGCIIVAVEGKVTAMRPVILVSAPWALYNRPSIQLGTLKAYLRQCFPNLHVLAEHVHLRTAEQIGYPLYQAVSERTWIAECVAAALLFPEQRPRIETLFTRESRRNRLIRSAGLTHLTAVLEQTLEKFIQGKNWAGFGLVGFSVSLCQLTASLYLIRRIKASFPNIAVVVGGSTFSGESAASLTTLFPEINHLVRGEGETPLAELVDDLCRRGKSARSVASAGDGIRQIQNLDTLPTPDFEDYFEYLGSMAAEKLFFPVLPVEASRGCWWQSRKKDGTSSGCAFCNLNLQWRGYRSKSPEKVVQEFDQLTVRHKVLNFSFMDNLLPRKGGEKLFASLAGTRRQYRLFGEIRADTPLTHLVAMHRAGMRKLQVGIEALSSSLLTRMRKGTSALKNIEIMRHCEVLGMHHGGNLMLHFPGGNGDEVAETLENLQFASFFRPLKPVSFWLGLESPVFSNPQSYGIRLTGNNQRWKALFPAHMVGILRFMIQGCKGRRGEQNRLWRPVEAQLRQWSKEYDRLLREPSPDPILGYQDGRDFLIITLRRADGTNVLHRLPGASRQVYLFCRKSRSRQRIQARFPQLSADKLDDFLRMMRTKRLMFSESERFLSLAVPLERGEEDLERS